MPWTAEQKQAFLVGQFKAQRHHYRTYNAGCAFDIITHQGLPIGRLYFEGRHRRIPRRRHRADAELARSRPRHRHPHRAPGAGRASGRPIGIMVEKFNPAMRLYRRLGFADVADHGVYQELEWLPGGAQLNVA